jgi:uncharacterized protein YqfB (UPF0267 family)
MYNYNGKIDGLETKKTTIGVVAQDIREGISESGYNPDDFTIVKLNDNGFYSVDYVQLIPVLIDKINELEARLEKLEDTKPDSI